MVSWKLDSGDRERLVEWLKPRYSRSIADHVTLAVKLASDTPVPADTCAEVVGRADDGGGLEALVVAIGGSPRRPDGSIYHITWPLDDHRRPRESNDVVFAHGWKEIAVPVPVALIGARL